MIGMKKRVSIFAAVAFAIAMASPMVNTPAYADAKCSATKNKKKGCKNEIKGCAGFSGCLDLKGKAKKQCSTKCKQAVVRACKDSGPTGTVCSASPSGAFLE
jgi:hypothetical protein